MGEYVLALDQGTTSCRSVIYDRFGEEVAVSQSSLRQSFPKSGWVEQDPVQLWQTQLKTIEQVLKLASLTVAEIVAIGVTNQRETVVVWDRVTGDPVYPAIGWQDRRTAGLCKQMIEAGLETAVSAMTGLRIDPYFSATKVQWILDNVAGARKRSESGELCMGTVDSWLVWKLTEGKRHITDATNASRTLLYNIHSGSWDEDLLRHFSIPRAMLAEIVDSSGVVGSWRGVPIAALVGDQQAALFGQGCHLPGMAKNTYGSGSFLLLHTGDRIVQSEHQLLTTVAWQIKGKREFAIEGAVFTVGSLFEWLRTGIHMVSDSAEFEKLAGSTKDSAGAVIVPALSGLGAPHWDPFARASMMGLSAATTRAHLCRAVVDAICFRSVELLESANQETGVVIDELRVDGGAALSDVLMQSQADYMGGKVLRSTRVESTAWGAAGLAGLAVGYWQSEEEIAALWRLEREFSPVLGEAELEPRRRAWDRAVSFTQMWSRAGESLSC